MGLQLMDFVERDLVELYSSNQKESIEDRWKQVRPATRMDMEIV